MTNGFSDSDLTGLVLEQADRLLAAEVTREVLAQADAGDYPAKLWQVCEDAGLPAALLPESAGGTGIAFKQGMRLVRRLGYHAAPLPLAETMLANLVWHDAGGTAPQGSVCVVPGESIALHRSGARWTLRGTAQRVPWGRTADRLLLEACDADGVRRLALLASEWLPSAGSGAVRNLAGEPRETLCLDEVVVGEDAIRPSLPTPLFAAGALLRAQQMAGAMERTLDFALDYAMERKQFGRPIGKFQAIQHMLAEAAGHYAAAVAAADLGADAWGSAQFEFAAAIAKSRVGEAAGRVAAIVHQVHGAMGFTQEHPLHFSTRRLWSWRDEFGSEAHWQAQLGRLVCGAGGEALWPALAGD